MMEVEFSCGETVTNAAKFLQGIAPAKGMFNGQFLECSDSKQSVDDIVKAWNDRQKKHYEEYRKSPEYKKRKDEEAEELKAKQSFVNDMFAELKQTENSKRLTMEWFAEFSQIADHIGLKYNRGVLINHLKSLGIKPSMNTDDNYDHKSITNRIGYVLGQALSNLANGMPPHPIIKKFSDEIIADLNKID